MIGLVLIYMQRNTQRLIISENSTHTFLKPLNEFLNGYSEIKLLCLWLSMSLNVSRIFKWLFPVSMHKIDKRYYNTQHSLKSDLAPVSEAYDFKYWTTVANILCFVDI